MYSYLSTVEREHMSDTSCTQLQFLNTRYNILVQARRCFGVYRVTELLFIRLTTDMPICTTTNQKEICKLLYLYLRKSRLESRRKGRVEGEKVKRRSPSDLLGNPVLPLTKLPLRGWSKGQTSIVSLHNDADINTSWTDGLPVFASISLKQVLYRQSPSSWGQLLFVMAWPRDALKKRARENQ